MLPGPVHPPGHPLLAERHGQVRPGQATLPPPVAGQEFAVPTLTVRSRRVRWRPRVQHGVPPGPAPGGPRLLRKLHRKLPPVRGR